MLKKTFLLSALVVSPLLVVVTPAAQAEVHHPKSVGTRHHVARLNVHPAHRPAGIILVAPVVTSHPHVAPRVVAYKPHSVAQVALPVVKRHPKVVAHVATHQAHVVAPVVTHRADIIAPIVKRHPHVGARVATHRTRAAAPVATAGENCVMRNGVMDGQPVTIRTCRSYY